MAKKKPPPDEPPRMAYSYKRWSKGEQVRGDSQRRQTEAADRACAQHGWTLADESYTDPGVSSHRGRNRKKGRLSEFLAALEGGSIPKGSVLILEDFDRLTREKIMEAIDLVRKILSQGCDIYVTMTRKMYTATSLEEMTTVVEMVWRFYLSHEESAKKGDRSRKAWTEKHRTATKPMTTICPWWLEVNTSEDGRTFVLNEDRVQLVKRIFSMCIEGKGTGSIVAQLNREGIKAKKTTWNQKTIHSLLTDKKVLGHHQTFSYGDAITRGEVIENYYPQVIPDDIYHRAQNAIAARKVKRGRPAYGGFVNLFSGIVHHTAHDCSMIMLTKPRGGIQYRYLVSFHGYKGLRESATIPYMLLENVVLKYVVELKPSDFGPEPEVDEAESKRAEVVFITGRIAELGEALESVGTSIVKVVEAIGKLEARKTEVLKELEGLQAAKQLPRSMDDARAMMVMMEKLSGEELKEMRERVRQRLLMMIERIDVSFVDMEAGGRHHEFVINFKAGGKRTLFVRTKKNGRCNGVVVEDGIMTGDPTDTANGLEAMAECARREG